MVSEEEIMNEGEVACVEVRENKVLGGSGWDNIEEEKVERDERGGRGGMRG